MIRTTLAILACLHAATCDEFVTMLRKCRGNHAHRLNECLVEAIRRLQPRLSREIPELNLQRIDPMTLEDFGFQQTTDLVSIAATSKLMKVYGLSKFNIKYLDVDFEDLKAHVEATVPLVTATGPYNVTGVIFGLPIHGNGDFTSVLKGIVVDGHGVLDVSEEGHISLQGIKFNFKAKDMKIDMRNLFDGNEILRETILDFINNNSQMVLEELWPVLQRVFNGYIKGLVDSALAAIPSDARTVVPNANTKDKHRQRTLLTRAKTKSTK